MHVPNSINIILHSSQLIYMYIFVCYTFPYTIRTVDALQVFLFSRPIQDPPFIDKFKPRCTILIGTGVWGTTFKVKWDSRCASSDFTSMSPNRLPRTQNRYMLDPNTAWAVANRSWWLLWIEKKKVAANSSCSVVCMLVMSLWQERAQLIVVTSRNLRWLP